VETGKRIREFVYNTHDIKGMVINSDEHLSIFSYKGKIWNAATWKDIPEWRELRIFREYKDTVNGVALNANQQLAVVTSVDQTLKVWQVGSDHCVTALQIGASINCCAMSADGKTIVAGDGRGGVHFLELVGADELLAKDVKIEKSWLALKKESEQKR
jgi:WD40 repeat protein